LEKNTEVKIPWKIQYLNVGLEGSPSCLLLHGFFQTARRFGRQVSEPIDQNGLSALALQAPFPVYRQNQESFDVGYSWYF